MHILLYMLLSVGSLAQTVEAIHQPKKYVKQYLKEIDSFVSHSTSETVRNMVIIVPTVSPHITGSILSCTVLILFIFFSNTISAQ